MKSVTEFWSYNLLRGLKTKTDLMAEGKTPEEIQVSLGAMFKLEGDKLKYFFNAVDVAGQNIEKLSRILVVSLNEGEQTPPKAVKIDEMHYVPDFQVDPRAPTLQKTEAKGGQGKGRQGGRGGGGPKESPWGLSPEQKAAKKAAGSKANKPH